MVLVLPTTTAPASVSRCTQAASALPSNPSGFGTRLQAEVGIPLVAMTSLIATGRPCNGPRSIPSASSASA
jgi:hypothetical protein